MRWLLKAIQENTDKCILWPFGFSSKGTTKLKINGHAHSAHRIALILFSGVNRKSVNALHSCSTNDCVNPRHLYWGSARRRETP